MITLPAPETPEVPVVDVPTHNGGDEDCPPKGEGPDGPSTPGGEQPGDGDGTPAPGGGDSGGGTDAPSGPGDGNGSGTGTPGGGQDNGSGTGSSGDGSSTDTGSSPGGGSSPDGGTGSSVGDDVTVPVAHEVGHPSRVPGSGEGRAQLAQTGASAATGMELSAAAAMLAFGAGAVVYARRKREA